jgi:hypothetical protein
MQKKDIRDLRVWGWGISLQTNLKTEIELLNVKSEWQ